MKKIISSLFVLVLVYNQTAFMTEAFEHHTDLYREAGTFDSLADQEENFSEEPVETPIGKSVDDEGEFDTFYRMVWNF